MTRRSAGSALAMLALVAVSVVMGLAALSKLRSLDGFVTGLHRHEILPAVAVPAVALTTGLAEAALAVAGVVLASRTGLRAWPALGMLALLGSFSVYLGVVLVVRGPHEGCSCGAIAQTSAGTGLVRNLVLAAGVLVPVARG